MRRGNLKCIPLLLQVASIVNGLAFYNPPKMVSDPEGYKIIERNNKILFKKLDNKDARDFARKLKTEEIKTSVWNAMKKHEGYIDGYSSEIVKDRYRDYVKIALEKQKSNMFGGLKRVLVKRPVPHGYQSKSLEYDSKHKSFFKPLMRVHIKRGAGNRDPLLQYSDEKKRFIKFRDLDLLKPLFEFDIEEGSSNGYIQEESVEKVNNDMAVIMRDILVNDAIQNYISPKQHKMRQYTDLHNLLEGLRTNDISKQYSKGSSEDSGTIEQEMEVDATPAPDEMQVPAPDKPFHHMFQYWTYQKNIHEDDCPGDMLKIGNVCSWIPPH